MRNTKILAISTLLIWTGCQYLPWGKDDAKPIFVGEPETIIVQPPEDALDVSYRWSIIDLPDESLLVPDFSSSSNVFTFTADVEGDYAFAVAVESYGEDVEEHVMEFRAMEDTSLVPIQVTVKETVTAAPAIPPAPAPQYESQPGATIQRTPPPATTQPAPTPKPRRTRSATKRTVAKDAVPGHYTIQVSSWKTAKQAQSIRQSLVSEGYDAYIQRVWLEDRQEVWWRVRVGDFESLQAAKNMRDALRPTYSAAWVDNVRQESLEQER